MKKTLRNFFLAILFPCCAQAQVNKDSTHLNTYLFEEFSDGVVLMKSGNKESALLNYNTLDQGIVFKQGTQVLSLVNLLTVDTVYLKDKKFIPVKNLFYEFTGGTAKTGICISYTSRTKPVVATSDHNGTSRQTGNAVSNTVSNVYVSRSTFNGDYIVEFIPHYWVKSFNDLYKANNERQFIKGIPSYMETAVKDYFSTHKIDFSKETDLVSLVNFCNAQKK
jgi:hypothetical protein